MQKICVVGLGYIGLPTATMFATHGFEVLGVDVNPRIIEILGRGDIHIEEPGLRAVVKSAVSSGQLRVGISPQEADVFILAVPTPVRHHANTVVDGVVEALLPSADLSYVEAAGTSIVPYLRPGNLVVLESTSPPGTTLRVLQPILEQSGLKVGTDLHLTHCPERVLPGRILEELVSNDRIIGGFDTASAERARHLYAAFVKGPIFLTDATTAETVKLMENTYRDVNIALANELALVSEQVGIDVREAIALANRHPRVNIHQPGPGVGGHCIAVDPWFIAAAAPDNTPLIQTARKVNDAMPHHVVALVSKAIEGIKNPTIACLGLTYKSDVDDIRESPAIVVVHLLEQAGFAVRAFDPHVPQSRMAVASQIGTLDAAVRDADCLLLLTDHSEFKGLTPDDVKAFTGGAIVDTRAILQAQDWHTHPARLWQLGSA